MSQTITIEGTTAQTADATAAPARRRLAEVDRAKTFAMALVVSGHLVASNPPAGAEWWWAYKDALYQFHMPFFMFLSGMVFFHTGRQRLDPARYAGFVLSRFRRLLVPYLVMGLLVLVAKTLAVHLVHIDNPPGNFVSGLVGILGIGDTTPALFIWYLAVLFVFSAATPLLLALFRGRLEVLMSASVLLFLVPMPSIFYLDRIAWFFPFFLMGGLAIARLEDLSSLVARLWPLFLALFGASLALYLVVSPLPRNGLIETWSLLVVGTASIPALYWLVADGPLKGWHVLDALAPYIFSVYLFNTIFIGIAKAVALRLFGWEASTFPFVLPLLFVCGFFGPMVLKRFVLSRWRLADQLTS